MKEINNWSDILFLFGKTGSDNTNFVSIGNAVEPNFLNFKIAFRIFFVLVYVLYLFWRKKNLAITNENFAAFELLNSAKPL